MEWIDRLSDDVTGDNIEALLALFPDVATEVRGADGELQRAVDYDALREKLGDVAEGGRERYQFTWPGKREARAEASRRIDKVLRPCVEESKDWDTTQNLYIEGDNLDALKILRKNYAGKIKMIYIDPPYNTGNDFIYDDDFVAEREEYKGQSGDFDERGRLVENRDTNGRFHSDWCSMMLPRLLLARDLLTDDGVIFISIDDHEQENLKKVCDEVFGGDNFIAQLIWERAFSPKNDAKYVSNSHDYVLMYAKNVDKFVIGRLPRTAEANSRYSNPDNDLRGVWMSSDISVKTYNAECDYPITTPSGRIIEPPAGRCWRLSKKAFSERLQDNRIWFGPDGNGVPRLKRFLTELRHEGMAPTSLMGFKDVGHSQEGSQELSTLFDGKGYFDGPKPTRLLRRLITLANLSAGDIVLDFFSGSGTTAHALMKENYEKNLSCPFIMVQLDEATDADKDAYEDGYKTICEIGKKRLALAGKALITEIEAANAKLAPGETPKTVPDIGFRVLKIDSSNYDDVTVTPGAANQAALAGWADNIKPDRTSLDLLFSVFGDLSIPYSASIETLPPDQFSGHEVFSVQDGSLVACFDTDLDNATIEAMAKLEPSYCVVRDASFEDDAASTNFEELFKTFSPDTDLRVL